MFCWVCASQVRAFESYGVPARVGQCPHCGAKPRYRAVVWFLREVVRPRLPDGARVLDVGPSRLSVTRYPTPAVLGAARYTAVDLRPLRHLRTLRPPHHALRMNVTRLGFATGTFALVLCNNVLPYVANDAEALAEMRRCLDPEGMLMVNTYRVTGPTLDAATHRARHPELGDEWYAANGDRRVYGEDFFPRLRASGLWPRALRPFAGRDPGFLRENGLNADTEFVLAFADPLGASRFGADAAPPGGDAAAGLRA